MKTAISIPNDVFQSAQDFARRRRLSRSALFTTAVLDYLARHRCQDVTRQLDQVYGRTPSTLEPIARRLQGRLWAQIWATLDSCNLNLP